MTHSSGSPSPRLWHTPTLATACGGTLDGPPPAAIAGISIDTRTIQPGDLFVALQDQRDGHDFVGAAFKAGAAAALVGATYLRQPGDGALIRVEDPLRALEDAGRIARFRTDAKVVAITGSVGKTGTKEMLRLCLSRLGATHASEKSYNNHWGVPLTLARMPAASQFGVFEIGMNHTGEITPLTRMVAPDVGVITTVGAVHLGNFSSVTEIAEAKAELLTGLAADGVAILNRDNEFFELLAKRAGERGVRVVGFGSHAHADVRLIAEDGSDAGSTMSVSVHGRPRTVRIGAPGRHYVMNALAVIAALDALGADLDACLPALAELSAPPGRGARFEFDVPGGQLLLIDESYNAQPPSMVAALATLGGVPRARFGRRVAVLGDMLELAEHATALHLGLKGAVEAAGVDVVFACGEHMRALYDALPARLQGAHAPTSLALLPLLIKALGAGDVVMIKGSNGTKMAPLVAAVRALSRPQR